MFPYTFCLLINTKGRYFGLSFIFNKPKKISHLFISQMIVQFFFLFNSTLRYWTVSCRPLQRMAGMDMNCPTFSSFNAMPACYG